MIQAAVLGYGTVGSGVVKVLESNADVIKRQAGEEIHVKYVLDLRDFPGDPIQERVVHDFQVILNDQEIRIVAEVMGGVEPAYTFVKQAICAGKSAVTSNKEMVAVHGAELCALAKENGVNFLFEASVGGGIPVLRPIMQSLLADHIHEISGILNGTTNYMLTKMDEEEVDYDSVLKEAQDMGYAERHPEADVEGFDACRKIAILTSLAGGRQVNYEDISTEGITKITTDDFAYAKALDGGIKLLGTGRFEGEDLYAKVSPVLIGRNHPLYPIRDVYNGVLVRGDMLGDVMFYGKGAGKEPTASAVVSDMVTAARYDGCTLKVNWEGQARLVQPLAAFESRFLIRVSGEADEAKARQIFGEDAVCVQAVPGEYGILTGPMKAGDADEACRKMAGFIKRIFADL